jgi:hypothetical protein
MRRSASEILNQLESRIARLENRTASSYTTKVKNPLIVKLPVWEDEFKVLIWAPRSEIKNIEGFGGMFNGSARTLKGQVGPGSNPMMCTSIEFNTDLDQYKFLKTLSKTYTLIEPKA